MRCVGGEVGATSSLAPKIGPLGLVSLLHSIYFSNTLTLKIYLIIHGIFFFL